MGIFEIFCIAFAIMAAIILAPIIIPVAIVFVTLLGCFIAACVAHVLDWWRER